LLNRILDSELAGVIRYSHYSLLVYGYNRTRSFHGSREQATESLTMITHLGAYPSLGIGPLLDSHPARQSARSWSNLWSMKRERSSSTKVAGRSGGTVGVGGTARQMVYAEELYAGEVDKILRKLG
jgi:bacterioferritin